MSFLIKIAFLIVFSAALNEKVFAGAIGYGEDDAVEVVVDPTTVEDYEFGEDFQFPVPARQWKRFWSPHPSDYNPMRRPGSASQGPRSNKRADTDTPYHPIPRSIAIGNKPKANYEDLENLLEDLRDKRQSPGSFLLMKLGRLNKAAEVSRKMGRRATLPYSLKSGTVHVKTNSNSNQG